MREEVKVAERETDGGGAEVQEGRGQQEVTEHQAWAARKGEKGGGEQVLGEQQHNRQTQ